MYNMTLEEMMLFAKICAYVMGDESITLDQLDRDAAIIMLKKMADNTSNWNETQKQLFKMCLDSCRKYQEAVRPKP